MSKIVKIGTRDSQLAVWQGNKVREELTKLKIPCSLVLIKSDGDLNYAPPLYELGIQGIFTKALDSALLAEKIDIAIHSYKDLPTALAKGIALASVLPRDNFFDLLVSKVPADEFLNKSLITIATGSIRRKAQWLNKYPSHKVENIRGNINTRVKKLMDNNNWDATILSQAGVERIDIKLPHQKSLDWMLPAPSQGAIAVTTKADNKVMLEICEQFNHYETQICTGIERDFLKYLYGGCSTPIGALAILKNNKIYFKGNLLSVDGKEKAEVEMYFDKKSYETAGKTAAASIKENGGAEILKSLKKQPSE